MIRFVDMSDALETDFAFAWFDTVTDTFMTLGGEQIWYKWEHFEEAWWDEPTWSLNRFWGLFPPFHSKEE